MVGKLDHEPAVHAEEVEEDCVYGEEEINVDEEESVPGEEESNVGEGDSVHSEEEEEAEEVIFETFGVATTADNDTSREELMSKQMTAYLADSRKSMEGMKQGTKKSS